MNLIKNLLTVGKKSKLHRLKHGPYSSYRSKNSVNCYLNFQVNRNTSEGPLKEILHSRCREQFYRTLTKNFCQDQKQKSRSNNENHKNPYFLGSALTAILGYYFLVNEKRKYAYSEPLQPDGPKESCGDFRSDLPTYSMKDVKKHATAKDRIWVTYREGVYDITDYVKYHPGAEQILHSAGGPLEPVWIIQQFHVNNDVVSVLMEKYRIGNLQKEDQIDWATLGDPYSYRPKRHPDLLPLISDPFNGEVSGKILVENFITPNEYFYVRSHLHVPNCDPNTYRLEVEVEGTEKTLTLTLDEIKKLPKTTITATLMCSGNRRSEVPNFKSIINWGIAGMSNAKWSGVRLCEILEKVGVTEDEAKLKHVQFEGMDLDHINQPYSVSIPIWKAVDKRGDVLLAYEMNGVPLPPDHGFPLRVIIPGVAGARNAKWLARIIVSTEESSGHYQKLDYKGFSPSTNFDNVDFTKSPAVINVPVTSAICNPLKGETVRVQNGHITLKGYAYSGGGQKIVRVDVTSDGGDTWHVANLDAQDDALPPRHWAWTLWSIRLPVPENATEAEIWCKAVDSNYNTQPEDWKSMRNFRAVLNNPFHKVKVKLSTTSGSSAGGVSEKSSTITGRSSTNTERSSTKSEKCKKIC